MRALPLLLLAIFAASCTTDVGNDALTIADNDVDSAVTYGTPSTVASERFYYEVKNDVWVGDSKPNTYGHFDLLPRGSVNVTLTHSDGRRTVGFKVYRVNPTGTLRYLGEVSGRRTVSARVESNAGGTIVIQATGTWAQGQDAALSVLVSCARRDGQCAVAQQPGEGCGTRGTGSCDEGLFCDFSFNGVDGDMCGASDRGGVCAVVPDFCTRICGATCGCDGQTYCTACVANAAGVSVAHEGACEDVCDPSVYSKVPDDQLNVFVHGTWLWSGVVEGYDVKAELGLYDGDFGYQQVWNPACMNDPTPCRVASRYFWISGGWSHDNSSVQLTLDAESTPTEQLAQGFSIVQNCEGDLRLQTTELGEEREFVRDLCHGVQCEETQHCEVQQVMCIRAPCLDQPACVEN